MKRENRAFWAMFETARERLAAHTPEDVAARSGVLFQADPPAFQAPSLGRIFTIGWPGCEIEPESDDWRHLTLLHYLDLADGSPLPPREMPFSRMQGGLIRGGDFDRRAEEAITRLAGRPPEQFKDACAALGASFPASNADLCAVFPFLPRFPLTLKVWFADDEFDASGRLLVNEGADHYLTIEDAVTAGEVLLGLLEALLTPL